MRLPSSNRLPPREPFEEETYKAAGFRVQIEFKARLFRVEYEYTGLFERDRFLSAQ